MNLSTSVPSMGLGAIERRDEDLRAQALLASVAGASLALLIIKSFSELRSSQEHDAFVAASEKTI